MRTTRLKKTLSPIAVIVALALAPSTAGTMAYLTATSSDLNLFTLESMSVSLSETDTPRVDRSTEGTVKNEYLIEKDGNGAWGAIAKDPKVTVSAGSADCWLFVALGESENFDDYLSYQVIEGWTPLYEEGSDTQVVTSDGAAVWYREVAKSGEDQTVYVLAGESGAATNGAVTVRPEVTETQVRALGTVAAPNPMLSVTAYAVQRAGFDNPADAWTLVGA